MRSWSGFEVLSCGLGRNVWGRGEGLRRILIFALGIVFCLTASAANGQKSSKRRKKHPKQETPATENTNAPDKELYDRVCVFGRSEEHTSELQSPDHLVCRLLLEKKKSIHTTLRTKPRSQPNSRTAFMLLRRTLPITTIPTLRILQHPRPTTSSTPSANTSLTTTT